MTSFPVSHKYLGLFHLHDVGLAVSDAVVDVVDVGGQRLHLFIKRDDGPVGIRVLAGDLVPLFRHLLSAFGQLLTLLYTKNDLSINPNSNLLKMKINHNT